MVKPRVPVINWNNPITKGLFFCMPLFDRGGTVPSELVSKVKGSFAGSPQPTWVNKIVGSGLNYLGTASGGEAVYWTPQTKNRGLVQYSIECLVKMTGAGANNQGTMFRWTDNTNSGVALRNFDSTASSFLINPRWTTTSGAWRVTGITTNVIYHVVATYDGSSLSNLPVIYINGLSQALTTVTSPVGTFDVVSDSQYIVGNANQTGNVGTRTWQGDIYYVNVYNRILSSSEVKQLYTNPWQIYVRPKAFMPFIPSAAGAAVYNAMRMLSGMGM